MKGAEGLSRVTSISLILVVLAVGLLFVTGSVGACDGRLRGFEDGTYRGIFMDRGEQQVGVEFTLKDNVVVAIRYRHLMHQGTDYLRSENAEVQRLAGHYKQLIEYLVGKDIRSHLHDLHNPGDIVVEDDAEEERPWWELERYAIDALTGATARSSKIVSAIRDALSRGVYSY